MNLDQKQPGFPITSCRIISKSIEVGIPHRTQDTYSHVKEKFPKEKPPVPWFHVCRRGHIVRAAAGELGANRSAWASARETDLRRVR